MMEYIVLLGRLRRYIAEQRWTLAYNTSAEIDKLEKELGI